MAEFSQIVQTEGAQPVPTIGPGLRVQRDLLGGYVNGSVVSRVRQDHYGYGSATIQPDVTHSTEDAPSRATYERLWGTHRMYL